MFRICLKRNGVKKKKKKKRNEMTTASRLSIKESKKEPPTTINAAKDTRSVRDTIPFMMSWNL